MAGRKTEYPTGRENGMSFIANKWRYTGPQGYRVVFDDPGTGTGGRHFRVLSYAGSSTRPVHADLLTEHDAHCMAARLSGLPVHPPVAEG